MKKPIIISVLLCFVMAYALWAQVHHDMQQNASIAPQAQAPSEAEIKKSDIVYSEKNDDGSSATKKVEMTDEDKLALVNDKDLIKQFPKIIIQEFKAACTEFFYDKKRGQECGKKFDEFMKKECDSINSIDGRLKCMTSIDIKKFKENLKME